MSRGMPEFLQRENRAAIFGRTHRLHFDSACWGFVVFRTTTDSISDDSFNRALEKFKGYLRWSLAEERVLGGWSITAEAEELVMAKLKLPVVSLLGTSVSDEEVREAMRNWREANSDNPCYLVEQSCLVLTDDAVTALVAAPEPGPELPAISKCVAWVKVVDVDWEVDDDDWSYLGWHRVLAEALDDMYHLHVGGWTPMMDMAPRIKWPGQVPVYIGDPEGILLDDE